MKRIGTPPTCWFSILARTNPEEARALFVRKLNENGGSMVGTSAALGLHWKRTYQFLYEYGLRGVPKQIRERARARFRLPAA